MTNYQIKSAVIQSQSLVQLPDDVKDKGIIQTDRYQWETVYYSPEHDFEGTQWDFLRKGYAYAYTNLNPFKRVVLSLAGVN